MSNIGFLTARCWLDEDGQHVWLRHKCLDGVTETMLPRPTWRAADGRVEPSISCDACDLHVMAVLESEGPGAGQHKEDE